MHQEQELEKLQETLLALSKANTQLVEIIDSLKEKSRDKDETIANMDKRLWDQGAEIDRLHDDLQARDAELHHLNEERNRLHDELQARDAELSHLKAELDFLKSCQSAK